MPIRSSFGISWAKLCDVAAAKPRSATVLSRMVFSMSVSWLGYPAPALAARRNWVGRSAREGGAGAALGRGGLGRAEAGRGDGLRERLLEPVGAVDFTRHRFGQLLGRAVEHDASGRHADDA